MFTTFLNSSEMTAETTREQNIQTVLQNGINIDFRFPLYCFGIYFEI